jgi:tetratricopeptide (TPR) repeat protein
MSRKNINPNKTVSYSSKISKKHAADKKSDKWKVHNKKKSVRAIISKKNSDLPRDTIVNISDRYLNFWNTKEIMKYKHTVYIYGLPGYKGDIKFKVNFVRPEKLIEDINKTHINKECYLPVAELIRSDLHKENSKIKDFLTIRTNDPRSPVSYYDMEKSKNYDISESFDMFLEDLVDKKTVLPVVSLDKMLKKARSLYFTKKYDEAYDSLKGICDIDQKDKSFFGNENLIVISFNYLGLILKKMERFDEAIRFFDRSLEIGLKCGQFTAFLNIIDTYEQMRNYSEIISRTEHFRTVVNIKKIDNETSYMISQRMGIALIHMQQSDLAISEFKWIIRHFAVSDKEKIFRAINVVYGLISDKINSDVSKTIVLKLINSINSKSRKKK